MTPPVVVLVEWLDSCSTKGWVEPESIRHSPSLCRSVGWLVDDGERSITLVAHMSWGYTDEDPPTQYEGLMIIPKSAIIKQARIQ